ncbi:MAG TPA: response regulator transcription factor [Actinomycetes bacterium]|nr:response regulator transcription factor [Actinomycetes bacterium]
MGESLRQRDLRAALDIVHLDQPAARERGLPRTILEAVSQLVAADFVYFNDFDSHRWTWHASEDYPYDVDPPGSEQVFMGLYWSCRYCSSPEGDPDRRRVRLLSDYYSLRQWRGEPLFVDCLRATGVIRSLMVPLTGGPGHSPRLVLARTSGSDFSQKNRALLSLVRPHLNELYRRSRRSPDRAGALTPRQRELIALVARGLSNREIAAELFLAPGTVRKHLENIFERLGVSSRLAAVALVFPDGLVLDHPSA